ncbi:MAG: hypothetical protein AAF050_14040 [Cyanobacteria bacterium J06649_5]
MSGSRETIRYRVALRQRERAAGDKFFLTRPDSRDPKKQKLYSIHNDLGLIDPDEVSAFSSRELGAAGGKGHQVGMHVVPQFVSGG